MYEAIDFKKSLLTGKVKWIGVSQFWRHFPVFSFPGIWTVISSRVFFEGGPIGFKISCVVFFCLILLCIYGVRKNAKLVKINVTKAPLYFRKILENEIVNSGWHILRSNQQYLTASKPGKSLPGSRVTILYNKKSVFINVQNNESLRGAYAPFSFGRNSRIKKKFISTIKNADRDLSKNNDGLLT